MGFTITFSLMLKSRSFDLFSNHSSLKGMIFENANVCYFMGLSGYKLQAWVSPSVHHWMVLCCFRIESCSSIGDLIRDLAQVSEKQRVSYLLAILCPQRSSQVYSWSFLVTCTIWFWCTFFSFSQELLAAVDKERLIQTTKMRSPSSPRSSIPHSNEEDFHSEEVRLVIIIHCALVVAMRSTG